MIRSMAKVHLNGQMVESILANGTKVNSMERVHTSKMTKRDSVFGRWERELSGSKIAINNKLLMVAINNEFILNYFNHFNKNCFKFYI